MPEHKSLAHFIEERIAEARRALGDLFREQHKTDAQKKAIADHNKWVLMQQRRADSGRDKNSGF